MGKAVRTMTTWMLGLVLTALLCAGAVGLLPYHGQEHVASASDSAVPTRAAAV